jgi:hypothetical protein
VCTTAEQISLLSGCCVNWLNVCLVVLVIIIIIVVIMTMMNSPVS